MEQTNRTILFEEINPQKNNLFTIIDSLKEVESLTDEAIKEIEKNFVIHSFDEFIQKFDPTIYMQLNLDEESITFNSSQTPLGSALPIKMNQEHKLVSMFTGMLDYKLTGKAPIQKISRLADYVLPQQDFEGLTKLRGKVKKLFIKGKKEEASKLLSDSGDLLGNPLLQLQFLIKEGKLLSEPKKLQEDFIHLEEKEEMQIHIVCQSAKFAKAEVMLPGEMAEEFADWLWQVLNDLRVPAKQYVRMNLISVMEYMKLDAETYIDYYNKSIDLYSRLISECWASSRALIQTMLGIKAFFLQYGQGEQAGEANKIGKNKDNHSENVMPPSLLVANISPDEMTDLKKRESLRVFLETVNQKNTYASTLWYAILPKIEDFRVKDKRNMRERFVGNKKQEITDYNSADSVKLVAGILAEYKIQNFLSIEPNEENTFQAFARDGMDTFYESFHTFEKESYTDFLIPCYPNFRILLRDQAKAEIGHHYKLDEIDETIVHVLEMKNTWMTGIYIDASYVAAGLVAAYQSPDYLSRYFKRTVDPQLPGVAYHILDSANRNKTKTLMAKEICGYEDELTRQILSRASGVIFGCERSGVTLLTDKTMALQTGNKVSISHIQTMTYLERIIRSMTQDFKVTLIKQFFVNRQDNKMHQWMQNKAMINSLFKEGETIEYHIDEKEGICNFEVRFKESMVESKVRISR